MPRSEIANSFRCPAPEDLLCTVQTTIILVEQKKLRPIICPVGKREWLSVQSGESGSSEPSVLIRQCDIGVGKLGFGGSPEV